MVLLFHLGGAMSAPYNFGSEGGYARAFSFGAVGVEFFFVLSGFIIYYVHERDLGCPDQVGSYLFKRITRVYPIYLILYFTAALGMAYTDSENLPDNWSSLLLGAALIPQQDTSFATGAPVLYVAWTLQYEMYFYLFFAIGLASRWAFRVVGLGLILGVLLGAGSAGFPMTFLFSQNILLFFMGIAAAIVSKKAMATGVLYCIAVLGLAIFVMLSVDVVAQTHAFASISTLGYGLSFSLLVLAMIKFEDRGHVFLKHPHWQLLGGASYVLYLVHDPMITVLSKVANKLQAPSLGVAGGWLTLLAITLICIYLSVAIHLFIERPIGKACKRLHRRWFVPRRTDFASMIAK